MPGAFNRWRLKDNREPGASPGRSRHCKRGVCFNKPLNEQFGKGGADADTQVRKPACHVAIKTFRWKRGLCAVLSSFG